MTGASIGLVIRPKTQELRLSDEQTTAVLDALVQIIITPPASGERDFRVDAFEALSEAGFFI